MTDTGKPHLSGYRAAAHDDLDEYFDDTVRDPKPILVDVRNSDTRFAYDPTIQLDLREVEIVGLPARRPAVVKRPRSHHFNAGLACDTGGLVVDRRAQPVARGSQKNRVADPNGWSLGVQEPATRPPRSAPAEDNLDVGDATRVYRFAAGSDVENATFEGIFDALEGEREVAKPQRARSAPVVKAPATTFTEAALKLATYCALILSGAVFAVFLYGFAGVAYTLELAFPVGLAAGTGVWFVLGLFGRESMTVGLLSGTLGWFLVHESILLNGNPLKVSTGLLVMSAAFALAWKLYRTPSVGSAPETSRSSAMRSPTASASWG
jgi:hypothetical protein